MSAITAKASRKMKKYAVLTREPRCFLGSFDFSWEQRKVSDLAEKTYGGGTPTTSNEAYWNGDIPWIQSSDVVDGKLLGVEPRKWITQDGLNNSAAQLIPGNSIAIITRVGVGKLAFMPYSYATSQDFLSLSKLNAEPLFTVYACYKKLQSELNAVQGTSIKGITKDELLAKNIMVPRYAEQQQIGAFFKQLDHLITLHQRKCVFLFGFFQAFISMIFTASTFSWEQRKVSELFRVTRGYVLAATQTETTKTDEKPYPVYSSQTKDKGLMGYYKDYLYEDAITWTTDGANAGTVNYRAGKFYCTNVCGVLLSNEVKANQMIAEALNSVAKGYVSYVGNPKLMNNVMADIVIQIPTQAEEREQLSSFFAKLDNLITLHQRECISFTARAGRLILTANKKRNTSSWEQRKAKELFVSTADKGYPELPVLSATQDRGMIRRDENSINIFHDKKNEAGYKRVLPGQFVIHLRSFQGGFAHSAIEGITSPAYTVFGFSEPEKHDSEYWKYVFTSKSFIQRLETVTYGIRDGRSISYEEFLTLGFVYPSKAEQTAIARYLDKLSDLITLHQRKPFLMKWRTSDANRNQTNRLVL